MSENVKLLGIDDFDEFEKDKIKTLAYEYYDKIKRDHKGLLILHGKKINDKGNRCVYNFNVKLEAPDPIVAVQEEGWDLALVLHKALSGVENAIQKKFKTKGK